MRKTILSTADVATLFNVTETTVKRWADDGKLKCQKTPGGHRKFPMREVIVFAESFGFSPIGTLSLARDSQSREVELSVLRRDFGALAKLFVLNALTPSETDLPSFLSYLYQHHIPLADIYDEVVRPGMIQIGEQWKQGKISPAHEHRSSNETIVAITQLQAEIRSKVKLGTSALCACPEEEQHEIGLRCISSVLQVEGWTVHYVGARVPMKAIGELCIELRPSLVCLSVTMEENTQAMLKGIKELREIVDSQKGKMVLGGSGVMNKSIPYSVLNSSKDLLRYARTAFQENRKPTKQPRITV